MIEYTYEEALDLETIDLDLNDFSVYTKHDGYKNIPEGLKVFPIRITDEGEYEVYSPDGSGPIIGTTDGKTRITCKVFSSNPYDPEYYVHEDLDDTDNVEKKLLEAFYMLVHDKYSFGGPLPWIDLVDNIYLVKQEGLPIGEAVIGESFIIE